MKMSNKIKSVFHICLCNIVVLHAVHEAQVSWVSFSITHKILTVRLKCPFSLKPLYTGQSDNAVLLL
jgi:hypothetical protein